MKLKTLVTNLLAGCLVGCFSACETVDNDRIPAMPVNIDLGNPGLWNTYGVSGYGQYRYFNREKHVPANFNYTASTYTGYGGVLLLDGINGPMAYDAACPYEVSKDAVVSIDSDNLEAVCSKCGSRFNVFDAAGAPVSGPALERRYGMLQLRVIASGMGYIVTR